VLDPVVGTSASGAPAAKKKRPQLWFVCALLAVGIVAVTPVGRSTLVRTVASLDMLRWPWLIAAVTAEAGSMAAFARAQRRLLRAAGSRLALASVMAVTYAGNAISASLPLAGPGLASAFSMRQFRRRGIDSGVTAWTMIVSGMVSSFALALVLGAGAIGAGSVAGALVGLSEAAVALLPAAALLAGLRFPIFRRAVNRALAVLVAGSRRLCGHPGPGVAAAFEAIVEKVAAVRVAPQKYLGVLALSVWNWVANCLCLVAAIQATGAAVPWHGVLLAYGAGLTASSIGLTPGGVGVTEAALSGGLVVAGMRARSALDAVLVYRLLSFWLVVACGWVVMAAITRRQRISAP
jgi:putative heme transporter